MYRFSSVSSRPPRSSTDPTPEMKVMLVGGMKVELGTFRNESMSSTEVLLLLLVVVLLVVLVLVAVAVAVDSVTGLNIGPKGKQALATDAESRRGRRTNILVGSNFGFWTCTDRSVAGICFISCTLLPCTDLSWLPFTSSYYYYSIRCIGYYQC